MAPVSHQGSIIEGVAVSSLEDAMIEITPDVWLLRKSRGPAVEEGDDFENQRKFPDDILAILRCLGDFADGFYGKSIANALVPTRHKLVVGRSSMVLQRCVPALLKEPASVLPFNCAVSKCEGNSRQDCARLPDDRSRHGSRAPARISAKIQGSAEGNKYLEYVTATSRGVCDAPYQGLCNEPYGR